MRFICTAILVVIALACGGEPEQPVPSADRERESVSRENRPPIVGRAQVLPRDPTVGQSLALSIKVQDPDGDPIDLEVEWFHNGRPIQQATSTTLATQGFRRGDEIYAIVEVSDGEEPIKVRTETIRMVNQLPVVSKIRLLPETPRTGETLTVVAEVSDGEGDPFELSYEWSVNGQKLSEVTGASLPAGRFKRGDEVRVAVSARDSYGQGSWVRAAPVRIPNGAPETTSDPSQARVGSGMYQYAIKAVDPDGDRPLRYKLVSGPDGMSVDLISGVLTWRVPPTAGGSFPVEVAVSDPQGAEARQSYKLELHWETAPADAQ